MKGIKKTSVIIIILVLALIAVSLVYMFVLKPYIMRQRYKTAYSPIVTARSEEYGIDPYLVFAMIYCESSFNPDAVSKVGARGLMQIMPDTGEWLSGKINIGEYDNALLFDPDTNVRMGCWYMNYLFKRFKGDTTCAVAAYHSGQGNVDKWLKDPAISPDGVTLSKIPEGETSKYTNRALSAYEIYKELYKDGYDN